MSLTLDGTTTLPVMGGTGMGIGGGVAAAGLGGLLVGALLGNNGGGLFGGNKNGEAGGIAYDALQTQIQTLQGQVGANNIDAGITSINQNISGTSRDLGRDIANLATAQAAGNFTTLTSINGLGRDVISQANQAALQQLNSFNNLQFQNAQSTNQIIAQGSANAAAVAAGFCGISKAMAECCCEIKGQIAADGNATRALINDLNVQGLRDQLAAANNKVSNNEQNQYLLNTILTHLHPVVSTSVVS